MSTPVTIQYFDGCPSWQRAQEHLELAAAQLGLDLDVALQRVESVDDAERLGFIGSPTILIEGTDTFARPDAPAALACRVYSTPDGLSGYPSTAQLADALAKHRA